MIFIANDTEIRDNEAKVIGDTMVKSRTTIKKVKAADIAEKVVNHVIDDYMNFHEVAKLLEEEGYVKERGETPYSPAYVRDIYHRNKALFGKGKYNRRSPSRAANEKIEIMKKIAEQNNITSDVKFKLIKDILDTL